MIRNISIYLASQKYHIFDLTSCHIFLRFDFLPLNIKKQKLYWIYETMILRKSEIIYLFWLLAKLFAAAYVEEGVLAPMFLEKLDAWFPLGMVDREFSENTLLETCLFPNPAKDAIISGWKPFTSKGTKPISAPALYDKDRCFPSASTYE